MVKKLFKGTFNWYGEVHILHTHSSIQWRARINFCQQLSHITGYARSFVSRYIFNENEDRWKIEEITND